MAMTEVSIEDVSKAESWMTQAEALNKRTEQALKGLADDLANMKSNASGELVNQFLDTASDIYENVDKILQGMNGILETVTNVMTQFKNVIGEAFDMAGNTIRKLFH